jgi:diguanylate cyclase (GGDEF)-like protein/hemerythrin-like metal-binding protein
MESFEWDAHFETGLPQVDRQHHGLVDLINQVAADFTERGEIPDDVDAVFEQLAAYAVEHFEAEEALMAQVGVDPRHIARHAAIHAHFIGEIGTLQRDLDRQDPKAFERLVNFLVHWLGYHILGLDQNMARQIRAIRDGVDPAEAYAREELDQRKAMKPLVRALDRLFEILSRRNHELVELAQSLEVRVEERTRELQRANAKLESLSLTDMLTGLPNRRHAMRTLEALWDEATIRDRPLVVIMIDADRFKEVNDTHGHDAGDLVLQTLARELRHAFRTDDIVCRLGGDEFFVICPDTTLEGGLLVAEQTRARVAALTVDVGEGAWEGSISVGVASRSPEMKTVAALVKEADDGVYAAKDAGKNCVRTAQDRRDAAA